MTYRLIPEMTVMPGEPTALNLEKLFPRYKIRMSLDHVPGSPRDPWNFELLCSRWKAFVYPHGGQRLQAWITTKTLNPALAELQAAGCIPWQVGDGEATVIFDIRDVQRVFAVLKPRTKRRGNPTALAKLRAAKLAENTVHASDSK